MSKKHEPLDQMPESEVVGLLVEIKDVLVQQHRVIERQADQLNKMCEAECHKDEIIRLQRDLIMYQAHQLKNRKKLRAKLRQLNRKNGQGQVSGKYWV